MRAGLALIAVLAVAGCRSTETCCTVAARAPERVERPLPPPRLAVSADGRRALLTTETGLVLWDVSGPGIGRPLRKIAFDGPRATVLAFTRDGSYVVAGDETGGVRLHHLEEDLAMPLGDPLPQAVTTLACSPDGRFALVGDRTGSLGLYDIARARRHWLATPSAAAITAIGMAREAHAAAVGTETGLVQLVDLETGKARLVDDGEGRVEVVALAPGAERVVWRRDGTWVLREVAGPEIWRETYDSGGVPRAEFSTDGVLVHLVQHYTPVATTVSVALGGVLETSASLQETAGFGIADAFLAEDVRTVFVAGKPWGAQTPRVHRLEPRPKR